MDHEDQTMYPDEHIIRSIYFIRGQKVMMDRDLAILYGIETKRLKEAVKRNSRRFPPDFMFELSKEEFANWRSQFATSKQDRIGLRHAPYCFTEPGVTMLSCVLNSERAIQVNIRIIRIFTCMRDYFSLNKNLEIKLHQLESKIEANDTDIRYILDLLHQWMSANDQPRKPIGFRSNNDDE
jgi:hypothetical protein